MAKEDELYQAALASGSASADQVSAYGAGGGNVTESFGNVVSIAGKYGIRKDEVRVLTKLAREWVGKSVMMLVIVMNKWFRNIRLKKLLCAA